MKVSYDGQVDAVYIELLSLKPEGVIEWPKGLISMLPQMAKL